MSSVATDYPTQKLKLSACTNAAPAKSEVHAYKARGTTPIPEKSDGIEPSAKVPFAKVQEVRSWKTALKNQL